MHSLNVFADLFAEMSQRGGLLEGAMRIIGEEGSGVIVLINRPMPNIISTTIRIRSGQVPITDASQLRDYGVGAQILNVLGVHDMVLLTNRHQTPVALAGYGLKIVGEHPIPVED
jgi:3,4-dihydroxy 2-butanone 4-phosphate synthase/GTP cyclohydrolase II